MINTIKNTNTNAGKELDNNTNKGDIMYNVKDLLKGTKVLELDIPVKKLEEILYDSESAILSFKYKGIEKVYPVYTINMPEKLIFSSENFDYLCVDLSDSDGVIQEHDGIYEISTDVGVEGGLHDPKINFSLDISKGMNNSKVILDSTNLSFEYSRFVEDVDVSNYSYDLCIGGDVQLTDKCMSVMDTFADYGYMSVYFSNFKSKKVIVAEDDDMYYLNNGEKHIAKSGNFIVFNDLEKMEGCLLYTSDAADDSPPV